MYATIKSIKEGKYYGRDGYFINGIDSGGYGINSFIDKYSDLGLMIEQQLSSIAMMCSASSYSGRMIIAPGIDLTEAL